MQNLIKDNISATLKNIQYISVNPSKNKKIDFSDEIKITEKNENLVKFDIVRNLSVDLDIAYNLEIVVSLTLFAKDNVDLSKSFTDEFIEKNKDEIAGNVMNFISALISQITGSFNGFPIVTPPIYKNA